MTTIAILGTGNVGKSLGATFERAGYGVRFGERSPASIAAAVSGARFVFLAIPAEAVIEALESAGDIDGKIIVDCTNPIVWESGPVRVVPPRGSNAAHIQATFPKARVLKAFNTMPAEVHALAEIGGRSVDVLFAGDDPLAKTDFAALTRKAGFVPRDAGTLRNAAHLESLAVLVIHLGTIGGLGREIAFNLERRDRVEATSPHAEVVETLSAPGFSPQGGEGFELRPLAIGPSGAPTLLLGTLSVGGSIPREIHEKTREHLMVLDGELEYSTDDGSTWRLQSGQMSKLGQNVWHRVRNDGPGRARFIITLT